MDNLFSLSGKTAIVTGANTGIGQDIAVAYAHAGANVVGVGRSPMDETRQRAEAAGGGFLPIRADLLDTGAIADILGKTLGVFGRLDIMVNNAGIIRRADALEYTENDWDDILNTNLKTLFFFCQAAAKQFRAQNTPGKIINIASLLSYQGGIRVPAYTAAKSGVIGVTRALANEWARFGINVNGIAPGYIATNNTRQLREDPERSFAILERIPAGRWGTPADISGTAVFLASAASNYIHGFTVAVDGGWLAR